jgi:hypothetical protein
MARRLPAKLRERLDNYAILYCFSDNGIRVNGRALRSIRTLYRKRIKRRRRAIRYYRELKRNCSAVKRGLEGFAKSYGELEDPESQKTHDDLAMELITTVFSEDRENVHYLKEYYERLKKS